MKMLSILFKGKFTFINYSEVTEIKNVAFPKKNNREGLKIEVMNVCGYVFIVYHLSFHHFGSPELAADKCAQYHTKLSSVVLSTPKVLNLRHPKYTIFLPLN